MREDFTIINHDDLTARAKTIHTQDDLGRVLVVFNDDTDSNLFKKFKSMNKNLEVVNLKVRENRVYKRYRAVTGEPVRLGRSENSKAVQINFRVLERLPDEKIAKDTRRYSNLGENKPRKPLNKKKKNKMRKQHAGSRKS